MSAISKSIRRSSLSRSANLASLSPLTVDFGDSPVRCSHSTTATTRTRTRRAHIFHLARPRTHARSGLRPQGQRPRNAIPPPALAMIPSRYNYGQEVTSQ